MTKFRDRTFTESDLTSLRRSSESRTPAILKVGSPQYQELVQRISGNITRAAKEKVEYTVPDITQFGTVASAPDHFTSLMLMNVSLATADNTVASPCLVATSYALIRGRLVFLIAYRQFTSGEDIAEIKKFAEEWIAQIHTDNP